MAVLPANLALANIADGASIVASDHRNNYSSIQTDVNALIAVLAGGATNQVLTSGGGTTVAYALPSGYQFDKTQATADTAAITATTEATAGTVLAGGSYTYDGSTLVKVEFWSPAISVTVAPTFIQFVILRGATVVGQAYYTASAVGAVNPAVYLCAFDTPTAISTAYTVKAFVNANSLSVLAGVGGAGVRLPMFLRATKA